MLGYVVAQMGNEERPTVGEGVRGRLGGLARDWDFTPPVGVAIPMSSGPGRRLLRKQRKAELIALLRWQRSLKVALL